MFSCRESSPADDHFSSTVEGLVANAVGGLQLYCTQSQFQIIDPPAGEQCVNWLQPYTSTYGGYAQVLSNGQCGICPYSSGDQYLAQLNMSFSHRWRDLGFMFAYIGFNIGAAFLGFYLYSVFDWSRLRRNKSKPTAKNPDQELETTDQQGTEQVGGPFMAPA